MTNLKDLLSDSAIGDLTSSIVQEGDVFRFHLSAEEGVIGKNIGDDGRNKYFIVIGHDREGNAIGLVLIDTHINPNLPLIRQQKHYKILAAKYSFLNGTIDMSTAPTLRRLPRFVLANSSVQTRQRER